MTVDDPIFDSNSFLLPGVRPVFYNAPIPYKHWQLRSLLCSPAPNILYYPTNSRIFSLNTETLERKLVAILHFEPRCIGAKYGWVCAGGVENGQFAAIRVADGSGTSARDLRDLRDMPVDGPGLRHDSFEVDMGIDVVAGSVAKYVRFTELGGSIVNSITLHKQIGSGDDGDVVAILTNNDKTVRIFSLTKFQLITTLNLPFHTNHASISPDGRYLVVVGDSPKVIFYEPSPLYTRKETKTMYTGWVPLTDEPLTTGCEALISTNFSPSSSLCAVASQEGSVTIFDMHLLRNMRNGYRGKSPIVETMASSRPRLQVGAVRSVQFSPSPWDLLIWAEHTGRVSIVDVRTRFCKREIVNVAITEDKVVEKQLLGSVEDDRDMYLGSRMPSEENLRYLNHEHEDMLQEQHSDNFGEGRHHYHVNRSNPHSSNHLRLSAPRDPLSSRFLHTAPSSAQSPVTDRPETPNQAHPQSPPSPSSSSSFLYRYRLNQEINRLRELTRDTRRFSTGEEGMAEVLSIADENAVLASLNPRSNPNIGTISGGGSNSGNNSINNNNGNGNGNGNERPRYTRLSGWEILGSRHLAERVLIRASGDPSSPSSDRRRSPGDELDITGCTLSCDGTKLYVATTIGILEYAVDLTSRRVFPRIQPR